MNNNIEILRRQYELYVSLKNGKRSETTAPLTLDGVKDKLMNLKDGEILKVQVVESKED